MRINHNLTALNTYNRLSTNTLALDTAKTMEKLGSGLRINKDSDTANFDRAKRRLEVENSLAPQRQVQDTQVKLGIAEGSLNETQSMLNRMRELATQAINDTYTDSDRTKLQEEFNTLNKEITRIGDETKFNGQKLLDGSLRPVTQTNGGQDRSMNIGDMRSEALGISDLSISSKTEATAALSKIEEAMSTISDQLSSVGEESNRQNEMLKNLQQSMELPVLSNSTSRITSINIEEEMKKFEEMKQKLFPLVHTLHQNQNPLGVLQLLRG
ncbi:flagellin [Lysinibacillus sp. BW-2-10]|uniref:flagellin N-terminal helical domain-containing protein n=1 Tax=Lysinibacillus sp. BW-2-10 TaxID=2590030 RepID=UPI00117C72E0|nr:flagellin [Lysinibacillus sp. BW-2-10]TSI06851.1 flagellin [Lysinibacillus sp. BW-2-10]